MLKRAAEDSGDQGEAKKAAGPKGVAGGGTKADSVVNPIPRLFSQNSITIHISQRTFEELSPKELKWLPISQYYAAMFDKFHYTQFMKYYDRCCTFTISKPKVRLSNLLMLQDDYTTTAGTPKDVSVFTQACYMMSFTPTGMKNWFKLGCTGDCGQGQEYLKYKPLQYTDCKLVSQLIKVGPDQYTDFETLVVNPCKPDIYAGWHDTNAEMGTDGYPTKTGTEELDKEWPVGKAERRYIYDAYISPRNRYLAMFSCSVKNADPHIPLMKHTTYMRNLDKVSLHKYGDTISFNINTNLEGVPLMKHPFNTPFQGWYDFKDKSAKKYKNKRAQYVFCYPSKNRPFFSRKDNLEAVNTITGNKELGSLSHHFLTMPPIKKGDGSLIKQRCSFIMEQSISITFHFPETVSEDQYDDLLSQSNGVILRPAIESIWQINEAESTPPIIDPPEDDEYDKEREKIRKENFDKHKLKPPTPADYESGSVKKGVISELVQTTKNIYRDATSLAYFCKTIGLLCPIVLGAKPLEVAPNFDRLKRMPYTALTNDELENMIDFEIGNRDEDLFGYLFHAFLVTLQANQLQDDQFSVIHTEIDGVGGKKSALAENQNIYNQLEKITQSYVDIAFSLDQCPAEHVIQINIRRDPVCTMREWDRQSGDYDAAIAVNISNQWYNRGTANFYPMRFGITLWIEFLSKMGILVMPSQERLTSYVNQYNDCLQAEIDEKYPRIKIKNIEPNVGNNWDTQWDTETFFV